MSNLGREHEKDVAETIAATSKYWKNSDEGASTSLVAALDPSLDGMSIIMSRDPSCRSQALPGGYLLI